MARSTGPILAAGSITWVNSVLLGTDDSQDGDFFTASTRIVLATGLAAGMLYGVEVVAGELAVALAWAAVVTVLFVRVADNQPTALERAADLIGG